MHTNIEFDHIFNGHIRGTSIKGIADKDYEFVSSAFTSVLFIIWVIAIT